LLRNIFCFVAKSTFGIWYTALVFLSYLVLPIRPGLPNAKRWVCGMGFSTGEMPFVPQPTHVH